MSVNSQCTDDRKIFSNFHTGSASKGMSVEVRNMLSRIFVSNDDNESFPKYFYTKMTSHHIVDNNNFDPVDCRHLMISAGPN